MKRRICGLLALLLCLSLLAACGRQNRPDDDSLPPIETPPPNSHAGESAQPPQRVGDEVLREMTLDSGLHFTVYSDWTLRIDGADVTENLKNQDDLKDYVSKIKTLELGRGVEGVGSKAFQGWDRLEKLVVGDDLREIGYYAFSDCSALGDVSFGSVEKIGEHAFSGCSSLKDVVLGDSVAEVGDYAFADCSSLVNARFGSGVTRMGTFVFNNCGSFRDFKTGSDVSAYAFAGCTTLVSLTLEDGVKSIGEFAFSGCTALRIINWPSALSSIGSSAFSGCTALDKLLIPGSDALKLGDSAFEGCTALSGTAEFGPGLESIGDNCFSGCVSVEKIILPSTLKSIGYSAFANTGSLRVLGYTGSAAEWRTIKLASGWNRSAGRTAPTLDYKG